MTPSSDQLDSTVIRSVIEKGIGLLERRCIRLTGRDPNWRALFSEELENLTRASSPAEFETRVNAVIARGGLSHVAFFHESAQRAPARYAINATFCAIDTPQGKRWLFEDVHEGGPAHVAGIRAGDLLLTASGKQIYPPELPTFGLGTDAELTTERRDGSSRQVQVVLPKAEFGKAKAKPPWRSRRASSRERSSQESAT
jgi:predicted metalloprotease with PDZ domain